MTGWKGRYFRGTRLLVILLAGLLLSACNSHEPATVSLLPEEAVEVAAPDTQEDEPCWKDSPDMYRDLVDGYAAYKDILAAHVAGCDPDMLQTQSAAVLHTPWGDGLCVAFRELLDECGYSPFTYCYILLEMDGQYFVEHLGSGVGVDLYAGDIDGDGYDELVRFSPFNGTGRPRYTNEIYRIGDTGLEIFYRDSFSAQYDEVEREYPHIEDGFVFAIADGFCYTVENRDAGFVLTYIDPDLSDGQGRFEQTGSLTELGLGEQGQWYADEYRWFNYSMFYPVDVDGDGVCEILTREPSSIFSTRNQHGDSYTALRYDPGANSFVAVRAGFYPYLWGKLGGYPTQEEYEESWYLSE